MQEEILSTYNEILDYTKEIKAAIEDKDWERVNLLASHREKLFQKTNAFVLGNTTIEDDLKKEIMVLLEQIKVLDDANFEAIKKDKSSMEKLRAKVKVGYKLLGAYQSKPGSYGSRVDKIT